METLTIQTTSGTLVRGEHVDAGEVLELPRSEALLIVQAGRAIRVEPVAGAKG